MVIHRSPSSNTASELYHHGVKGQKWGVENGPPYPLSSNISTGKKIKKETESSINTKYIKRAALAIGIAAGTGLAVYAGYKLRNKYAPYILDKTLKNKKIYTLSIDEALGNSEKSEINRIYASFKKSDDNIYKRKYANSLLQRAKRDTAFGEESTNNIYQLVNKTKNMKVASIKNTEKLFENTYNTNTDFKNSVDKWFKSTEFTSRIGGEDFRINELYNKASNGDLKSKYELFNRMGYVNKGNEHTDDVQKIFKKVLNKNGYTAIYDLNDIKGDYKAKSPIIVINPDSLIKQASNKIYDSDIQKAKNKYIKNANAEIIYKYVSSGLFGASAATYGSAAIVENKKDYLNKSK